MSEMEKKANEEIKELEIADLEETLITKINTHRNKPQRREKQCNNYPRVSQGPNNCE